MIVLMVLIVLLVLATPFVMMARDADSSSVELADRAELAIALDTAARHARAQLGDTHPSFDRTPYWDAPAELDARNTFDPSFYDANDPNGTMWDCAVEDVAGRIDVNSCPPQVLANLANLAKRFAKPLDPKDDKLELNSAVELLPQGYLWANGELIQYKRIEDTKLVQLVRGVLGPPEKEEWRGGPRGPSAHDPGEPLIDQRALALPQWRLLGADGELRRFEALEELRQAGVFELAKMAGDPNAPRDLDPSLLEPILRCGSVHASVCAGAVWQHATRVRSRVVGGRDGALRVESNRWFNPGATVRIGDGVNTELALVQSVKGQDVVVLDKVLASDFEENRAEIAVLARRPVNVNTASEEVLTALFTNLQVNGRNARVLRDEAERLAHLLVLARPIAGFEDLLKRVLLPLAGLEKIPENGTADVPAELAAAQGMLTADKLLAIYTNALNANDSTLLYSTMPLCFTSRDVYAFELRASVNAPSGVERASGVREEVSIVAPQKELLKLWARQEDFDDTLRLSTDAPGWTTGPNATSRYDGGASPPSRVWAHIGTFNGMKFLPGVTDAGQLAEVQGAPTAERIFASREETAWIMPWAHRIDETTGLVAGRALHFDHETRDPEGRYLPDEVVVRATDDTLVQWTDKAAATAQGTSFPLCKPLSFELWIKPRAFGALERYLDIGGNARETDRISLAIDQQDLVLRVLDGGGDHPDTPEHEAGEIRYALAKGQGPGLPTDVWSHIAIDVRGNRPSQMEMRVNGLAHGVRRFGMTRLSAPLQTSSGTIAVESVEGFPEHCTVRIGNELVEVSVANGGMDATHQTAGRYAGFGGRTARTRPSLDDTTVSAQFPAGPPLNLAGITTDHPAGTTVELYGYSTPIASRVCTGHAALSSDLGPWRIARVVGVRGTPQPQGAPVEATFQGFPVEVGLGFTRDTPFTGLVLGCPDDPSRPVAETMKAFSSDGGYAAIIQFTVDDNSLASAVPIGGIEIVRYSGWSGDTLTIAQRGVGSDVLPALRDDPAGNLARTGIFDNTATNAQRGFVVQFTGLQGVFAPLNEYRDTSVFVVPISISVPGAGQTDYDDDNRWSRFAQITELDAAERTEWLRYDDFLPGSGGASAGGHLVRSRPQALLELFDILVNDHPLPNLPTGGGGGPGGGGSGGGGPTNPGGGVQPGGLQKSALVAAEPSAPSAPNAAAPAAQYSPNWEPRVGRTQNNDYPISDAAASVFQFRGVLGTFTQAHTRGVEILPVFAVRDRGPSAGRPGSQDIAFLFSEASDDLGWPVRVHRAHMTSPTTKFVDWEQNPPTGQQAVRAAAPTFRLPLGNTTGPLGEYTQPPEIVSSIWVALQKRSPVFLLPASATTNANQGGVFDMREIARLVSYPSGELPRRVATAAVGGQFDRRAGEVPTALVDEVVFGDSRFATLPLVTNRPDFRGASLILGDGQQSASAPLPISETERTIYVQKDTVRNAFGDSQDTTARVLSQLPEDAGLLRIGDEIVCYDSRDPESGRIELCTNGRGLLGTRAQAHQISEPVRWLESAVVTFLASPLGVGDGTLTVASVEGFPPQGTVIVGDELIHYTRIVGGALEMPRASSVPGAHDAAGEGLFRGRFGTTPTRHDSGDAVILFPIRYWDRWAPRADASELHYFGFAIDQPAAFLRGCFFSKEDTDGARIGLLQRLDPAAPWDADPEQDKRLALWWTGDDKGAPHAIGRQSDLAEWRAFVRWEPGAFDARTGMPDGWRRAPRLRNFGATYFAPSLTLRSVQR